ncbi:MAG TPA: molecular chaperone TorD family protein [Syntrophomonadaceae bacterium]|nr:molecular chaperone TorD family protein [Syntrophomonadaceae bacterium]
MDIDTERIENLNNNMMVFSWMSKAVDYPDEKFAEDLTRGQFIHNLSDEKARAIKEYTDAFESADELLLDLQKDYTRMCFVSKPRLVPLFESVYKEGKLYQDSTFQIARLYDKAGIKLGKEFKLPPDHITLELEFMSYLIFQEIEAIKNGNKENEDMALQLQKEIMDKHLIKFGLSLGDRLTQHAKTRFYHGLGDILKDFLQFEFWHYQN